MNTIRLNEIMGRENDLTVSGSILYDEMKSRIAAGEKIVVDMQDASSLPSIFLNVSFGRIIDEYGAGVISNFVSFVKITRTQAERLQKYIQKYQAHS
ncbi:MAG: STAS-like domain-containing protein [Muribaculaceae bacterium]|nr:STAS-like domain-containing protein [Muribaculaceae bacterium]